MSEVKELLGRENEKRSEAGNELNAIQKSTMEHAQINSVLSKEQTEALIMEIRELKFDTREGLYVIPEALVYKIADILPRYKNDVRAIFYKERGINVEENDVDDKIIEIVSKYI